MKLRLLLLIAATSVAGEDAAAQQPRTLGAPDATHAEPFTLVNPGTVRELRDGRLIVADMRDKVVQLIDLRSGSATKIGREGSGPAEFGMPMRLYGAPGDSTFLFDPLNSRYLAIAPNGKPVSTFRMESEGGPAGPGGMRIGMSVARASDARGRLYYEGPGFAPGGDDGPPRGADSAAIMRYDRSTKKIDTLAWVKLPKANIQTSGGQGNMRVMVGGANPLTPRDEWTVFPDGRVAIVRASDYHVDWVLPNGAKSSSPAIRFAQIRITEADKKEEEALRVRASAGQVRMMMTADNNSAPQRSVSVGPPPRGEAPPPLTGWPAVKPPFRAGMASVWARPNGELWVRRTEPAGAKGTLYDVLSAAGAVTHQVRVTDGLTLVGFGNGTVYTVKLDADDLQYLQRHRVN